MDPTSITRGTLEVVNQALVGLVALGAAVLAILAVPLRNQWRLLARGPRWGNLWTEFEVEQRFEGPATQRRAA